VSVVSARRIELWVEPRGGAPAVNPVMQQLLDALRLDGAEVAVRVPEHEIASPESDSDAPRPDLILLKTATSLGLSRALAEEARGVRCLNSARASWRASDKAFVLARLAAAGLPVPRTYLTVPAEAVIIEPPAEPESWVSKPTRGIHGQGVAMHDAFPRTLPAAIANGHGYVVDDGTRLVQQRIGGADPDLKVYVAGRHCFAGRKRFAVGSYASDQVEPVALDEAIKALVLAAGGALGLRLFGVDLRVRGIAPLIVDLNPFPGYRGFPDAVPALREAIEVALGGGD
jgi:ribosomal protein S6--L-glutamate ligase